MQIFSVAIGFSLQYSNLFFYICLLQNSMISTDNREMESLKKECEISDKKCREAQEKYFSESDRLKGIIDEMQGMTFYYRYYYYYYF